MGARGDFRRLARLSASGCRAIARRRRCKTAHWRPWPRGKVRRIPDYTGGNGPLSGGLVGAPRENGEDLYGAAADRESERDRRVGAIELRFGTFRKGLERVGYGSTAA